MLFLVQRGDARRLTIASDIDPVYADAVAQCERGRSGDLVLSL